ncbi:MAG: MFS transporter [Marmoricola sp.]
MAGFRSLARNRDFTVLWSGQAISEIGSRMSAFVLPLVGYQLTGSTGTAAVAEAAFLLGTAITLLPAGVLADRLHRGRLMRVSSATGLLVYATLAAAMLLDRLSVAHLIVAAFVAGAASGLFGPAELSAVRTVVAQDDLPAALSQNQARQHVASLLGGPVGGALYGALRWLPFAADAVSYGVSFVLLGRIRTDLAAPEREAAPQRLRTDLAEGFAFVARHAFLRVVLVWAALVNLTLNALFFVAILRLLQGGFSAGQIGLADGAAALCGLLGAVIAPALIDRFATGHLTVVIGWTWVPLLVPLALWNHPAVMAVALGAGLLLNPACNAGIGAYRVAITPADLQGRVAAAMQFTSWSTMPLAPVIGGVLLAGLGGGGAIAVLAAATAATAMILTLSRSVRSVPRPAQWTSRPLPRPSVAQPLSG